MKKLFVVMILLAAVMLAACSSGGDDEATEEPGDNTPALPEATPADSGSDGTDDDGDEPGSDGYPGPLDDSGYPAPLLPTPVSPGYPAPSLVPTVDAYPGGFAILIRPAGVQCEDPLFADMDAAVAELEGAGIGVREASRFEMMVCQACGCPTSEQFRVLIDPADLDAALLLGWARSYE